MSRDQKARRSHRIRIDNNYFERVENFKYLGTNLTNQYSIQEEIKSRLKSGKACYYSGQKLMSSSWLYNNLKSEIYRTIKMRRTGLAALRGRGAAYTGFWWGNLWVRDHMQT